MDKNKRKSILFTITILILLIIPTNSKADDLKVKIERVTEDNKIINLDKEVDTMKEKSFDTRPKINYEESTNKSNENSEKIDKIVKSEYKQSAKSVRNIVINTKEGIKKLKRTIKIKTPKNTGKKSQKQKRNSNNSNKEARLISIESIRINRRNNKSSILISETIKQSNMKSQMIILNSENLVCYSAQKIKKSIKRYQTVF